MMVFTMFRSAGSQGQEEAQRWLNTYFADFHPIFHHGP
jgi:hypothetical protein